MLLLRQKNIPMYTTIILFFMSLLKIYTYIAVQIQRAITTNLKQHSTMFLQTNSFTVCQCQQTIVIHDRVHVLYPQSIYVTIIHNVLLLILVCWFVNFTEDVGKKSVCPVSSDWV